MYRYIWFDIEIRMRSVHTVFLEKEKHRQIALRLEQSSDCQFFSFRVCETSSTKVWSLHFGSRRSVKDPNSYPDLKFIFGDWFAITLTLQVF